MASHYCDEVPHPAGDWELGCDDVGLSLDPFQVFLVRHLASL